MADARDVDVVLFGATGFTGRLAAEYLAAKMKREPFRLALAGRNRAKLEEVRAALARIEPSCATLPILDARVDDPASLVAMARAARVVLTTVGPYAHHGDPVIDACVEAGTDYVDITGEPDFVARAIARHDEVARAKRLRVVSCCGFDSIPHDLGVLFTVQQLPHDRPLRVEGFVRARGTFSGGTWQSALHAMAHARETQRATRAVKANGSARKVHGVPARIHWDRDVEAWACPMPTIDPWIVLRSARALDEYGPDFSYGHYVQIKTTRTLVTGVAGVGALFALAQIPPARKLLERVRGSGEGPSAEERARGWFQVTFVATSGDTKLVTRVSGGDPGYDETAKMCSEAALCLARDRERLPARFGVITPAVAMGERLVDRLRAAGMKFEVVRGGA